MRTEHDQFAAAAQEEFSRPDRAEKVVLDGLGARLLQEFAQAESDRRETELRWVEDLRQYKGQYSAEVLALIGKKRSKVFVRKTRVKVKTADSRVEDLLFPAGSEKNWEVDTTPVPDVAPEVRQRIIAAMQQQAMQAQAQQRQAAQQSGQQLPPGRPVQVPKDAVDKAVLQLCKEASKKMAKVIDDQLSEVKYREICKKVIHSGHLFGTGVLKGPLVEKRIRSRFIQVKGKWIEKNEEYIVPFVDFVPIWRFYPDMAADSLAKCRYVYERHQMTYHDLAELASRKSFKGDLIREYLQANPQGQVTPRDIDNELKILGNREATQGQLEGRFEILERWGYLTGQDLHDIGVSVDPKRLTESFFANAWLLPNGTVVKAVLQPLNGVTWPYHLYYFDKDETSIFGEGLAYIMRDDQTMLNASTRMMFDNAAVSAGAMFEVVQSLLAANDDAEIGPWKVFNRNRESPGVPAVRVVTIPSQLNELGALANRSENNADEVSAIPRYMTGENVTTGAAATSSGMSMLMGASNIMIKDLVSNWDAVSRSFIGGMYRWNMAFNPDPTIKGDFDVRARGTASLVAREVRAQQLDTFSAAVANPMDAPFIKRDKLLRQRAEAHELADVVKTEDEVMAEQNNQMAQMQQQMQMQMAQAQLQELMQKVAVLMATAAKATAEVELLRAKTLNTRVESTYAALQGAGTAATNPHIAPAADEILRSAGWQDAAGTPGIGGILVGEGGGQLQGDMRPDLANVQQADAQSAPSAQPMTGHLGQQAGIETVAA